jgi:hypothetical protein
VGQTGVVAQTPEQDIRRAAERVTLACRALATASNDLRVAHKRSGVTAVDDAAELVRAETERVCELAEQLAKLGGALAGRPMASAGRDA